MTEIEVKPLDELYFKEAESEGYVYGTLQKYADARWTTFYVFAWLGKRVRYRGRTSDNPLTNYKKFINCTVRVALTQELLDEEKFLAEEGGVTVILYW